MRKVLLAAAAASLVSFSGGAIAASGPDSPTATHDNPSSCLGAERATRNSAGGDREKGGFGPEQADWVKTHQPYGQWLQEWKAGCENPPGAPEDDPS